MKINQAIMRPLLLCICCIVFFAVPLKVLSLGFLPGDDALRHAAFSVDHRHWNEVLVMNPVLGYETDSHPGWHGLLKFFHLRFGLDQAELVELSVLVSFGTFTCLGMLASGSPLAWLCACSLVAVMEISLFQRLLFGRPFFMSMTTLTVLLFIWTRSVPLNWRKEVLLATALLTLSICVHPTVWYLWSLPFLALVICRRWQSAAILGASLIAAICLAALLLGSWYNVVVLPVLVLKLSIFQDALRTINLVSELQPSGGPITGIIVIAGVMVFLHFRGRPFREQLASVDLVLLLIAWVLSLKIQRFWPEWGLPAMIVWFCRQIQEHAKLEKAGFAEISHTISVMGFSALTFFFMMTADIGGIYTNNLKNSLLTKPVSEFREAMPDEGGILYAANMGSFYAVYFRMPEANFRYQLGFEPGFMPSNDLKTFRTIQFNEGLIDAYRPWIEKMTPKDRLLVLYASKPEWPGMEFKSLYTMWIGRKIPISKNKTTAPSADVKIAPTENVPPISNM